MLSTSVAETMLAVLKVNKLLKLSRELMVVPQNFSLMLESHNGRHEGQKYTFYCSKAVRGHTKYEDLPCILYRNSGENIITCTFMVTFLQGN